MNKTETALAELLQKLSLLFVRESEWNASTKMRCRGAKPDMSGEIKLFENPFQIEDLLVFDDDTLHRLLAGQTNIARIAHSMQDTPQELIERIQQNLPEERRDEFWQELQRHASQDESEQARRQVLDAFFWELIYWKAPRLYEELTEGERLHAGIFKRLDSDVRGKKVLDGGAGSGRATIECLRHGAALVYAIEPSPGLRRILQHKIASLAGAGRVILRAGSFTLLPLEDDSVDVALCCSAFTAEPERGGEAGLLELKRVTRSGGKVVLIWPRVKDRDWLRERGFQYVSLPRNGDMSIHFRSLRSAVRCARIFYGRNRAVRRYLLTAKRPVIPFSIIGVNPPDDYCWLQVQKGE
ncbi:MAG: methyltransferase domain-containing protein [Ktedonobacteraceae bacterium]|nr:methyltransferase domain-containing protein [Ktedonobacteraceae bacterium]